MSIYLDAVEDLLINWGRAARSETIRISYKPGVLGRIKGSTVKSATIDPSDFEKVDSIISKLKLVDEDLHTTAGLLFIQNRTYDDVARKMKTSKRIVSQRKQSVISFVAGSLNDL